MAPTPEKRIPRKKCLSIGINYGDAKSKKTLRGPHRDAKKLTDLLINQFSYYPENVTLMLDVPETDPTHKEHLHPTYDNILRQIDLLVHDAQDGDTLVFHYSGHSGQVPDISGDEPDGLDECIITADEEELIDDILKERLVDPLPSGVRLVAIIDGCHSGSMLDLPHDECNRFDIPWKDRGIRPGTITRPKRRNATPTPHCCLDVLAPLKAVVSKCQPSASPAEGKVVPEKRPLPQGERRSRRKRMRPCMHDLWETAAESVAAHAHVHDVLFGHNLHIGSKAENKLQAPGALVELVKSSRIGIVAATASPLSTVTKRTLSTDNMEHKINALRLNAHIATTVGRPPLATYESPTSMTADEEVWHRYPSGEVEQSPRRFTSCNGNCRGKPVNGKPTHAHVISLSAAKDEQLSIESPDGCSMTMILVNEIAKNPQLSIQEIMTSVRRNLLIYWRKAHLVMRHHASQTIKRDASAYAFEKDFEFQYPVISSLAPLNLEEPLNF